MEWHSGTKMTVYIVLQLYSSHIKIYIQKYQCLYICTRLWNVIYTWDDHKFCFYTEMNIIGRFLYASRKDTSKMLLF